MKKKNILLLGARSDIAKALSYKFAEAGYEIQLAARGVGNLIEDKNYIEHKYNTKVTLINFDVLDINSHEIFVDTLEQLPDVVICAIGYLDKEAKNQLDVASKIRIIRSNFEGPASILDIFANKFEQYGRGILVGISSVAGERGRATNYIYGSAKAGFTAFLSGLRNRLAKKGVHVITVLPGFVKTKMTDHLVLPDFLTAKPSEVANRVFDAVKNKEDIIYIYKIWKYIMIIIRNIPESIFKKLKI